MENVRGARVHHERYDGPDDRGQRHQDRGNPVPPAHRTSIELSGGHFADHLASCQVRIRTALAAIHEPRMRMPSFCHSRRKMATTSSMTQSRMTAPQKVPTMMTLASRTEMPPGEESSARAMPTASTKTQTVSQGTARASATRAPTMVVAASRASALKRGAKAEIMAANPMPRPAA